MKKLINEIKAIIKVLFNLPTTHYEHIGYGIMYKGKDSNNWKNKQSNEYDY
jgi:hypothetical protein